VTVERRPSLNDPNRVRRMRLLGESDLENFGNQINTNVKCDLVFGIN